jgi:hypothetical protein
MEAILGHSVLEELMIETQKWGILRTSSGKSLFAATPEIRVGSFGNRAEH